MELNLKENKMELDLNKDCPVDHSKLVTFNWEEAKHLTSSEIRKRWPRITCSTCQTIIYASDDHYVAGDW